MNRRMKNCINCKLSPATFFTQCTHLATRLSSSYSYNRTDNYRQWNAVGSPDDGHKDARNMFRYCLLPINHYLLHLVGLTFTYCIKYRVVQEEAAILWEMLVCVILSKKVHMNMGPILNGYRDVVKRRYGPSCEHEQQLRNK